jgi:hypothetical protein
MPGGPHRGLFEHAYGRAPEQPVDDVGMPDNPDDVAETLLDQLKILALRYADELEGRHSNRYACRSPREGLVALRQADCLVERESSAR